MSLKKAAFYDWVRMGLYSAEELAALKEEALSSLNLQKLKVGVDNHCLVSITDLDGVIVYANEKFLELSGYSEEEVLGKDHSLLNSGYHSSGFFSNIYNTLQNGNVWRGEIRNKKKNGDFYWVDSTITPILDSLEKPKFYYSIRTETTQLKCTAFRLGQAVKAIRKIAFVDELTELPNRAAIKNLLKKRFSDSQSAPPFALIQIGLDRFKQVNETLGHEVGDGLLQDLASRLRTLEANRNHVTFYRWGGDEFMALVEGVSDLDVEPLCQEIVDILAIPSEISGHRLHQTCSIGASHFPHFASTKSALLIQAELAMMFAKNAGRDRFRVFNHEMQAHIDEEGRIENELRYAIKHGQIELYYQPQVDIETNAVTGLEALARWNHPELGVVSPGVFIPIAEKRGVASELGHMLMIRAIRDAKHLTDRGFQFGRIGINLSPAHFHSRNVLGDFTEVLARQGVSPELFTIECLESMLLEVNGQDNHVSDRLENFMRLGIDVELDDFGTGYASLKHLNELPLSGIKVDQSFIRDMETSKASLGIVEALLSIADKMRLRVVCEGVETNSQYAMLAQMGKVSIQGYYLAKPMNRAALEIWINVHDRRHEDCVA